MSPINHHGSVALRSHHDGELVVSSGRLVGTSRTPIRTNVKWGLSWLSPVPSSVGPPCSCPWPSGRSNRLSAAVRQSGAGSVLPRQSAFLAGNDASLGSRFGGSAGSRGSAGPPPRVPAPRCFRIGPVSHFTPPPPHSYGSPAQPTTTSWVLCSQGLSLPHTGLGPLQSRSIPPSYRLGPLQSRSVPPSYRLGPLQSRSIPPSYRLGPLQSRSIPPSYRLGPLQYSQGLFLPHTVLGPLQYSQGLSLLHTVWVLYSQGLSLLHTVWVLCCTVRVYPSSIQPGSSTVRVYPSSIQSGSSAVQSGSIPPPYSLGPLQYSQGLSLLHTVWVLCCTVRVYPSLIQAGSSTVQSECIAPRTAWVLYSTVRVYRSPYRLGLLQSRSISPRYRLVPLHVTA